MSENILLIGSAGVGKTWLMKSLINTFKCERRQKYGKFYFHSSDALVVVGKYDGTTFEGSDRLSMSVITDLDGFLELNKGKIIVMEGDRFTNSKVLAKAKPVIFKILGDGLAGRIKRGSSQSERQIRSITTRVANIPLGANDFVLANSTEAMEKVTQYIKERLCATS
jgi:ABC-type dipeptide/oligopeptide/nickel transport system ATPase component